MNDEHQTAHVGGVELHVELGDESISEAEALVRALEAAP